ncbi:MAG: RNA-binding protein [Terriglobales bacterium]
MKIYVAGFDDSTTLVDLVMLFNEHGTVTGIKMKQGERRKYALVEMGNYDAEQAIAALDRTNWDRARLNVVQSKW